jgi:hypothetical protein
MISRRQGGGDEAYCTYVEEADDDANKDSALIVGMERGFRRPNAEQVIYRSIGLYC